MENKDPPSRKTEDAAQLSTAHSLLRSVEDVPTGADFAAQDLFTDHQDSDPFHFSKNVYNKAFQ